MNLIKAQVNGLEDLTRQLNNDLTRPLQATCLAVATEIENRLSPYPAATIGNSPSNPSGHWYERGYGQRWKTGGRQTSQTMNRHWNIRQVGDGATLENLATYSGWVYHNPADSGGPHQAWFHTAHGWPNDEAVIQSVVDDGTVQQIATEQIKKELNIT